MTVTRSGVPTDSSQVRAQAYSDGQRQIDEIAGDGDVVGAARLQIAGDRVQRLDAVDVFAPAMPIDEAKPALAGKFSEPARPHREVQVGDMGEREHLAMMLCE